METSSMLYPFQTQPSLLVAEEELYRSRSHYYSQVFVVSRLQERQRVIEQRTRFTLFLRILMKRLERNGEKDLVHQAKRIVSICNKRHKMGDPKFEDLVDSMETAIRALVGEHHWIRCHSLMRYYVQKEETRKRRQQSRRAFKSA